MTKDVARYPLRPPEVLGFHRTEKMESIKSIAKQYYDFGGMSKKENADVSAVDIAVAWIRNVNPVIGSPDSVPAGVHILIPAIPAIQPIIAAAAIPVPHLPNTPQPPDPTPLQDPPIEKSEKISEQSHQDKVHIGCVYFHEFFHKKGPIQRREHVMGTVVWAEHKGTVAIGVSAASHSMYNLVCVYEADRLVVERWQWQELWHVWRRVCAEPGEPGDASGSSMLESKWVKLMNKDSRGPKQQIHCELGIMERDAAVKWADRYAGRDDAGDDLVKRGTDTML